MTTKEKIAVMQAFEDGKQCQAREKGRNDWCDFTCTNWNWADCDFRIKPEEKKPRYRDIPIVESDRARLRAEGIPIDLYVGLNNFVGFRFADGEIADSPVKRICRYYSDGHVETDHVERAVAVVVEE
jgi:hypothetical protein